MPDQIRVAIVDDQPLYREGVVHTISQIQGLELVGQGASAADACAIAREELPDLILLDISMPGGGLEAARAISDECPEVKIIMLTVSENEQDVLAALEVGARGYILKGVSGPDLVKTIISIYAGEAYVTPGLAARLLSMGQRRPQVTQLSDFAGASGLTSREEQILSLLAKGLTNREIAEQLELSEKTVKRYMTNVLQKLKVRNRVEAALAARKFVN